VPIYTRTGPWTNNSPPGISQAFLTAAENQLAAVQYGFNVLASPYSLASNVTINSGVTNTYTCTGGATGATAGATAILLAGYFNAATLYSYLQFAPHSGSLGQYMSWGNIQVTGINGTINASGLVPCDGSGKIDVKANTGNCTVTLYIVGFVY